MWFVIAWSSFMTEIGVSNIRTDFWRKGGIQVPIRDASCCDPEKHAHQSSLLEFLEDSAHSVCQQCKR